MREASPIKPHAIATSVNPPNLTAAPSKPTAIAMSARTIVVLLGMLNDLQRFSAGEKIAQLPSSIYSRILRRAQKDKNERSGWYKEGMLRSRVCASLLHSRIKIGRASC